MNGSSVTSAVAMTTFSDEQLHDISSVFELYLGLSRQTMPCEEAADVARILGFKAQPAFLSKFGKEEKRRVCLDVHQFVACISVCHSDHINHPKSKQIFTLMDSQRRGEVVLDDFVQLFDSTGGAKDLALGEQKILQQYIADAREKGNTGLSHDALQRFLVNNTAGQPV